MRIIQHILVRRHNNNHTHYLQSLFFFLCQIKTGGKHSAILFAPVYRRVFACVFLALKYDQQDINDDFATIFLYATHPPFFRTSGKINIHMRPG